MKSVSRLGEIAAAVVSEDGPDHRGHCGADRVLWGDGVKHPDALRTLGDLSEKRLNLFRAWLTERGAEILVPTNPWEVLRFRAEGETLVIYRNESGRLKVPPLAHAAYAAFRCNGAWSGAPKGSRPNTKRKSVIIRRLIERDGRECFYCGQPIADREETLEHLVAVAHNGPSHISNLVLAHKRCNVQADHLPVVEKVRLRERLRADAQIIAQCVNA